jgi:hypothetical protein
MHLLSIDPGTKSGWAFFDNTGLRNFGVMCGNPDKNFEEMKGLFNIYAPDYFVIESQFLTKTKSKGIWVLIESRFTWKTLARVNGCVISEVNPASWQSHFGLKTDRKIKTKYKRQKAFKLKIVEKAEEVFKKSFQENESDAVLIGEYYLNTNK